MNVTKPNWYMCAAVHGNQMSAAKKGIEMYDSGELRSPTHLGLNNPHASLGIGGPAHLFKPINQRTWIINAIMSE